MDTSHNSASSWPLDEPTIEPFILAKATFLSKMFDHALALVIPSESESLNPEEFPPRHNQSKLSKKILDGSYRKYHILSKFWLVVPLSMDQVCNPLLGWIALYEECLSARVRHLLFCFYIELIKFFKIPPCSIMPNSWHFICGFTIKAFRLSGS